MSVPWTITAGVRSSHLTGRHMARIAVLVMAALLAGCAEITFQQYHGPARPDADVSIVRLWTARTKNIFVTPGLIVEKIDGVEAGSVGRTSHAYVLPGEDRKSTRLNSSHGSISYAVFCLKKKKKKKNIDKE